MQTDAPAFPRPVLAPVTGLDGEPVRVTLLVVLYVSDQRLQFLRHHSGQPTCRGPVHESIGRDVQRTCLRRASHFSLLSRGPAFSVSNGIFFTVDFVLSSHSAIVT